MERCARVHICLLIVEVKVVMNWLVSSLHMLVQWKGRRFNRIEQICETLKMSSIQNQEKMKKI